MTRRGPRPSTYRTICLLFLSTLLAGPSVADSAAPTHQRLAALRAELQTLSRDFASGQQDRAETRIAGLRAEWEELLRLAARESSLAELPRKIEALRPLLWNLERAAELETEPPAHFPVVTPWATDSFGGNNDQCTDATPLSVPAHVAGTTHGADNDGQATCGSSFFSPDVWFAFTPTTSGTYSIDTFGSDYDTVLSVHEGCPGTTSNQERCNDDTFGHDSAVSLFASSGTTYWIRVSGFNGDSGDFQLRVGLGGTISGTVTSEETGLPLDTGDIYFYNSAGFVEEFASVASDGTYSRTLDSGSYFVSANHFEDHLEELYEDIPCHNGSCEPEDGNTVLAITNQTTEGIDFSLIRSGRISGTVTANDTGEPLPFADVRLYDDQLDQIAFRTADINGDYSFGELLGGTYRITAAEFGYRSEVFDDIPCEPTCPIGDGAAVAVTLGAETTGIDFGLDRLPSISGTVTALATGEPVSGVTVLLRDGDNANVRSAFTNFDGTYTLSRITGSGPFFVLAAGGGMAAEVYDDIPCHVPIEECDATAGAPFEATLNEDTPGIDFALLSLGSITGTVEDQLTGDRLSGVRVEAYSSSGGFQGSASTDSNGNYTVAGLDPGTYRVRTDVSYGSNYFDELYEEISCANGCDPSTGTPVLVAVATQTAGIDFTLEAGGSISGQVLRESTGTPLSADVELFNADGSLIDIDFASGGSYSFVHLPEGTYFLRTHTYDESVVDELYQDILCEPTCTVTEGTPVTTMLGVPTTGIDFELGSPPLANVSGFVRDTSGAPLQGVSVLLHKRFSSTVVGTSTASDGSFLFFGIEIGEYHARTSGTEGYADELFDDLPCEPTCNVSQGELIVLDDDVTGIDFELEEIGGFSGTVIDALTGMPLYDYAVEVWDQSGDFVSRIPVSFDGSYEVSLPPGTYYASTDEDSYGNHHLDELWDDIPCPGGAPDGCDPLTGTPITILGASLVTGIDFALLPPGRITGFMIDQVSGDPIRTGEAVIWDSRGNRVDTADLNNSGVYRSDLLPPGEYYVTNHFYYDVNYLEELYPDIPCFGGAPSGCDPTKGEAVTILPDQTTRHIDFELLPLGGDGGDDEDFDLVGLVTDESGQPLSSVAIDLWEPDGSHAGTLYTNGQGLFVRNLFFGDAFYLSTDNGDGLVDEVWQDISCPDGSAYDGLCDPTAGTLLEEDPSTVYFLDITLASGLPFFRDGFESGDTSGWSNAVGLVP